MKEIVIIITATKKKIEISDTSTDSTDSTEKKPPTSKLRQSPLDFSDENNSKSKKKITIVHMLPSSSTKYR